MKKLILGLEHNRQVYAFVVLGLILIIFPNEMGTVAPYALGIVLLLYGCLNIFLSLKYPASSVSLGDGIIRLVIGAVLLFLKGDSISIIGVVWAMISLYESAQEIDEFREAKKVRVISIISIVISIGLAVLLMVNPFAHFYTHVRILGLEIIASAFIKGKNVRESKKEKPEEN